MRSNSLHAHEPEGLNLIIEDPSSRATALKLLLSIAGAEVYLRHFYGKWAIGSRTQSVPGFHELQLL